MNAADRAEAGELPELPARYDTAHSENTGETLAVYTAAQLRTYGQQCARAASCGGGEVVPGVVWGDGPHEIAPGAVLVKRGDEDAYIRKWGGRRVYFTTPPTPSAGVEVTDAMVTKAARALCKRTASACNVNEEDSWAMYGHEYKADAFAALTAALERLGGWNVNGNSDPMTPTNPNERARELKPCPCGRAARIYDVSVVVETRGKKVVSCDDPECHWSMTGYGDEQVAERWNRRALSHAAAVEEEGGELPAVTLESALAAIDHVSQYNGPGRDAQARQMLARATPAAVAEGDAEEDAYVIDALAHLLAEISIIVNGPEPAGTKWSYHDLPAKVAAMKGGAQ